MKYFLPESLREAEKLKDKVAGSLYLGGGTVINWRGKPGAKALIDLKKLGLSGIMANKTRIEIGATARIQDIAENKDLPRPIIQAAEWFTSINVRNMATAGGTASGNFFVSNLLPVFAAYDASYICYISGRKKKVPLFDWLQERRGLICSIVIDRPSRMVAVREEKVSGLDFPSMVTAIGFSLSRGRIEKPVAAVSGATSKMALSEAGMRYLNRKKPAEIDPANLAAEVKKDIRTRGDVKISGRVKHRIIEEHVAQIAGELKRGA